jgi:hypothetical protein
LLGAELQSRSSFLIEHDLSESRLSPFAIMLAPAAATTGGNDRRGYRRRYRRTCPIFHGTRRAGRTLRLWIGSACPSLTFERRKARDRKHAKTRNGPPRKGSAMRISTYLRRQAEFCIALSRATIDLTVAGRLRALAADFHTKAAEWDNEHSPSQPMGCSAGGEMKPSLTISRSADALLLDQIAQQARRHRKLRQREP